jgi:hypothetical protein
MKLEVIKDFVLPIGLGSNITIPVVGKLFNIHGAKGNQYYYCFPIEPGKKWEGFQEGDMVSFGNAASNFGQIILISVPLNLILVQGSVERGNHTRFSLNNFAKDTLKVELSAKKLIKMFK